MRSHLRWLALVASPVLVTAALAANDVATSLTPEQIAGYLAGRGMGMAKSAELNGYPGPAHVLEFADELQLSAEQRRRSEALKARVIEDAKRIGARVVEREHELDTLFASRRIDRNSLAALTNEISRLQGELRRVHLQAHIDQTKALSAQQLARYAQLRGIE